MGLDADHIRDPMDPSRPSPAAPAFKNRRTGLAVFGVFTVMLGAVSGMLVPLMFFGQRMAERSTGVPADPRAMLPAMLMYGTSAVALVWLGIGSIMARRWARVLILIFSWTWLLMGIVSLAAMAFVATRLTEVIRSAVPAGQPQMTGPMIQTIIAVQFVAILVLFVLLPIAWILFYRSPHVRATCEANDPAPAWTDACPPAVLALSVWTALSAPMVLVGPLTYRSVFPFFGVLVTGLPAALISVVVAALLAYSAWALHRLRPVGWWLMTLGSCLATLSGAMTFARIDPMEMYRAMGFPEQQLEQMQKFSIMTPSLMIGASVLFAVAFVAYMLSVKKHFRSE